ncbi:MAG: hypothetical protein K5840_05440 [Eubacterium sp.]|nr:hypothetical protein [Eubacterium sp.]
MFSYETRLKYTETDADGYLKPGALLDEFQDCSTFQSDELGVGPEYLKEQGCGWIVAYHEILFYRRPKAGDIVTVGTNPYKMRGCMGYRNFFLLDSEGEKLAVSDSLWVYIDVNKVSMSKVPDKIHDAYMKETDEKFEMGTHSRKIELPDNMEPAGDFQIRKNDIDSNLHVNNSVYVYLASEFIPEGAELDRLRIEYKNAAYYGQTLHAMKAETDGSIFVTLLNDDGDITAAMEMMLK